MSRRALLIGALAALALVAGAPHAMAAFGPDASPQKYRIKDSLGGGPPFADPVAFNYDSIVATPGAVQRTIGFDAATTVQIYDAGQTAWSFKFYGTDYTQVAVHMNGILQFGGASTGAPSYAVADMANTAAPNNIIAPYWVSMMLSGSCPPNTLGVWTKAVPESSPGKADAKFIVEVASEMIRDVSTDDGCTAAGPPPNKVFVTYQTILHQTTNNIEMQLVDVSMPAAQDCPDGTWVGTNCKAAIGLENAGGSAGISYAFGSAQTDPPVFAGVALRIFPNHPAPAPLKSLVTEEGLTSPKSVLLVPSGGKDEDGDSYTLKPASVVRLPNPPPPAPPWVTGTFSQTTTGMAYTPPGGADKDKCGSDLLEYTLVDDLGLESKGQIAVAVVCINDKPEFTAGPSGIAVNEDAPPYAQAWATDVRPGPLTATDELASQTVTFTLTYPETTVFALAPTIDASGVLRFILAPDACTNPGGLDVPIHITSKDDGGTTNGGQDTGPEGDITLRINCVNDPPQFTPGPVLEVGSGTSSIVLPWATGVRAAPPTATDEANQHVSFTVANAAGAPLTLALPEVLGDGSVRLTLDTFQCGDQTFQVTAHDDGTPPASSAARTLTVRVPCGLEARDDDRAIAKGVSTADLRVLDNDSPPDPLMEVVSVTQPGSGGRADVSPDGRRVLYTPPSPAFTGVETFTYTILRSGERDTATVRVRTTDADLLAQDDAYTGAEDGILARGPALGVLANDFSRFPDMRAVLIDLPLHGDVQLAQDGSFQFRPDAEWSGSDRFTYAFGAAGQVSNTAVVHLVVEAGNDPPSAKPEAYRARPDKTFYASVDNGVLRNDGDPDGDALTVQVLQAPDHGALQMETDGSFAYRPLQGFLGTDRFIYRVTDGAAYSGAVLVEIVVDGNREPVADFTSASGRVPAGFELRLADRSFDPDGQIAAWAWRFGDGATATVRDPVHRYESAGVYTVTLTVTDGDGATAQATKEIQVSQGFTSEEGGTYSGKAPVADAGLDKLVAGGSAVRLDGSGADGAKALAFHWRQTEGPPVTLLEANTAFPTFNAPDGPATLAFELVIFDGYYDSAPDAVVVRVHGQAGPVVQAVAGSDRTVEPGQAVHLTGAALGFPEGAPLSYTWRQVDGPFVAIEGSGPELGFTAPEAGVVEVLFTVRGGGFVANDTVLVRVSGDGPVGFTAERGPVGSRDLVLFQPIVSGRQYVWDFGDGSDRSTETAPLHEYAKSGTYTVTLEVLQPDGRTATYRSQVRVFVEEPAQAEGKDSPLPAPLLLAGAALAAAGLRRRRNA